MFRNNMTTRGFQIVRFFDNKKRPCSIQQNSVDGIDGLWLGANESRMLLTRWQVLKVKEYLDNWLESKKIFNDNQKDKNNNRGNYGK